MVLTCAACGKVMISFTDPPPKQCAGCYTRQKRDRWLRASASYRDRQRTLRQAMRRRREALRLYKRGSRIRQQGETIPGKEAWLGGEWRKGEQVDVSQVPRLPPGEYNGRQARPGKAEQKEEPKRCEICERAMNLGRYKTSGEVCRKCREEQRQRKKEAEETAHWGTPEEIQAQLNSEVEEEEGDE